MRFLVCALTALPLLLAAPGRAGLRCDHDLVQVGESAAHLLLVCGEPLLRQTVALDDASTREDVVEQWTYDFGPGTLLQIVTIEAGKVAKIEDGERR
jgi:hypothetical protein